MIPRREYRYGDMVVFITSIIGSIVLYTIMVWEHGYKAGVEAPKVCAVVPGKQVISTTHDTCTYANSYGRSTTKRRAG